MEQEAKNFLLATLSPFLIGAGYLEKPSQQNQETQNISIPFRQVGVGIVARPTPFYDRPIAGQVRGTLPEGQSLELGGVYDNGFFEFRGQRRGRQDRYWVRIKSKNTDGSDSYVYGFLHDQSVQVKDTNPVDEKLDRSIPVEAFLNPTPTVESQANITDIGPAPTAEVSPETVAPTQSSAEESPIVENIAPSAVEAGQVLTIQEIQKIEEDLGILKPSPETWVEPVPDRTNICNPFGSRVKYQSNYFHNGTDYCTDPGAEFHAPVRGYVAFAGYWPQDGEDGTNWETDGTIGFGYTVWLYVGKREDNQPIYFGWAHLARELSVKPGQIVQPGQLIGNEGGTGYTKGPHTHLVVKVGGGIRYKGTDMMGRHYEGNFQSSEDYFDYLSGVSTIAPKDTYSNSNSGSDTPTLVPPAPELQPNPSPEPTETTVPLGSPQKEIEIKPYDENGYPVWIPPTVRVWATKTKDVVEAFEYDMRLFMFVMSHESMGNPVVVNGEGRIEGLYQVIPSTREALRKIINNNPEYQKKARDLKIDMSVDDPTDVRRITFYAGVYSDYSDVFPKGQIPKAGTSDLEAYVSKVRSGVMFYNAGTTDWKVVNKRVDAERKTQIIQDYQSFAERYVRAIAAGDECPEVGVEMLRRGWARGNFYQNFMAAIEGIKSKGEKVDVTRMWNEVWWVLTNCDPDLKVTGNDQ